MKTVETETYDIPIISFAEPADATGHESLDLGGYEPAGETDSYLTLTWTEFGHRNDRLTATLVRDGVEERYRFTVADADYRRCAYQDDADLPYAVIAGVYAFGFDIDNTPTIDDTLANFSESQALLGFAHDVLTDISDYPAVYELGKYWAETTNVVVLAAVLRYGVAEAEYTDIWRAVVESVPEPVSVGRFFDTMYAEAESRNLEHLLADEHIAEQEITDREGPASETTFSVATSHRMFEVSGEGRHHVVTLYTQTEVGRYVFQETGNQTCVYREITDGQVPTYVLEALESRGLQVTNVESFFTAPPADEQALFEAAIRFVDRIVADDAYVPDHETGVALWNGVTEDASMFLAQMYAFSLLAGESSWGEVEETVAKILDHLGMSAKACFRDSEQSTEVVVATTRLMPEAREAIEEVDQDLLLGVES